MEDVGDEITGYIEVSYKKDGEFDRDAAGKFDRVGVLQLLQKAADSQQLNASMSSRQEGLEGGPTGRCRSTWIMTTPR